MSLEKRPAIVILGAGFAGMEAARQLAKGLPADEGDILLVDRSNFFVFTPC